MGDRAWTTLLAWPYPGREHLPDDVVAALAAIDLLPEHDEQLDGGWWGARFEVLTGDDQSGPILVLADEEANYGVEYFRGVITALRAAGLHVYAGNDAGGDYCASWEYAPPGGPEAGTIEWRRWDRGEFVVSDTELLSDGQQTLEQIPDAQLAATVRRLLAPPPAIPQVVLEKRPCCF